MRVQLEYGRKRLDVHLPPEAEIRLLEYQPAQPLTDPDATLREHLVEPIGSPPLADLARHRRDACILICDITRPVPNELILTQVLSILGAAGLPKERILILVATGLHRPSTAEEIREMVGPSIAANYRIENHEGQRLDQHRYLGDSPRGVPIWIDRRYLDADLKIAVGLIEPHFMAGYSGGRKLICPGIAALETVRIWHGPKFLEHPLARSGQLDGNPVHEENTWIARRAGCDFIVNAVIDADRRPVSFVAGDMEQAFMAGTQAVRSLVTQTLPEPVDIVISSAAGYPLDTTFYQAVKGMVAAAEIVKKGGTIILAASLSEGIGSPEFADLFREHASLESFLQRILDPQSEYFVMDQWQLEELAKAARQARIVVVSDGLPRETIEGLFVETSPSVEEALRDAFDRHGPRATVGVIPKGPYVLARVAADDGESERQP